MSDTNEQAALGNRRSFILLAIGAFVGIMLAAVGFIDFSGSGALPDGVIALVNDGYVSEAKYRVLIEGFARDKRSILSDHEKAFALERLIEEELLVQRGVELGLLKSDTVVRASIVQAIIKSVIAEAAAEEITPEQLQSFYKENSNFFTYPERLQVRQISFRYSIGDGKADQNDRRGNTLARATHAYEALEKGMTFQTVAKRYGDPTIMDIPNTLLPAAKMREYIGPSLLNAAMKMKKGVFSQPLKTPSGYRILMVADRINRRQQSLDAIRKQVEDEYRKRRDDAALREYIDKLKDWADIARGEIQAL